MDLQSYAHNWFYCLAFSEVRATVAQNRVLPATMLYKTLLSGGCCQTLPLFEMSGGRTTRFFQSKRESEGIAAGHGPPGGGAAAQFTSIGFNLVRDGLDFWHLVEPGEEVLGQLAFGRRRLSCRPMGQREGDDSAVARQRGPRKRCLVSMRGNDSKNGSRLKSYGRFLNRFIAPPCRKAVLRSFLRRLGIQFAARQFVPGRGESDEHPSLPARAGRE